MQTFNVAVTGDAGVDIFTRYIPGTASNFDNDFYPEVAYDLDVPCGAHRHYQALQFLLGEGFSVHPCMPKKPTLRKTLQFLESFPWNDGSVVRISKAVPRRRPEPLPRPVIEMNPLPEEADFLVVHDATLNWRQSQAAADQIRAFLSAQVSDDSLPKVLVILGDQIPRFTGKDQTAAVRVPKGHGTEESSPVWKALFERAHQVMIVCSSTALRHAGAAISRNLSWEQTVEDTFAEFEHNPELQALTSFRHLVIRFGFVGALHVTNEPARRSAELVFAPNARDGLYRDRVDDGRVVGLKTVIAAAIIKAIRAAHVKHETGASTGLEASAVTSALKTGLTVGMQLFDCGFPCPSSDYYRRSESDLGERFLRQYFLCDKDRLSEQPPSAGHISAGEGEAAKSLADGYDKLLEKGSVKRERVFGEAATPESVITAPERSSAPSAWQIFRDSVTGAVPAHIKSSLGENEACEEFRLNIGTAICKFGHREVLNRQLNAPRSSTSDYKIPAAEILRILRGPNASAKTPPISGLYLPILEFGNLVAVEREEIESFRSVRNLLKSYLQARGSNRMATRPISIAVFGPPGSGKGFAIKQIAQSINGKVPNATRRLETVECNVAQFRTVDDLGQVMTRVASLNNERKIPLVFFDEFDCNFGKHHLGWLKYFLAPMQDGTFYGASQTITFGRAIFIFAGGISHTLSAFDPFARSPFASEEMKGLDDSDHPMAATQEHEAERELEAAAEASQSKAEKQRKRRKNGLTTLQEKFEDRKGPDFVSRLRGHMNIFSISHEVPTKENSSPVKRIIRRALTLRGQILEGDWAVNRDGCKVASVSEEVLRALLAVTEYRHGARSMEAILQMCTPIDGIIEKASLPSRAQLDMHVVAEDFYEKLQAQPWDKNQTDTDASRVQSTEQSSVVIGPDKTREEVRQPANPPAAREPLGKENAAKSDTAPPDTDPGGGTRAEDLLAKAGEAGPTPHVDPPKAPKVSKNRRPRKRS